ncbi:MAG: hypothetical protein KJO40_15115 [Deltaproteobacteria bacterium]|nr:hypothetical protein [Deltaproteobacteria bacterium]NND27520.1 hypothetical protein [Myxococcales bacterium]MBT8466106.1 hypothetical protein [Deltaproteobacteria bacterium]MBT8481509.1 hypothetical protein [Deltaproteobacteria bacterium]NNK06161.1 hypothetical protein [Myxococcales bacterium]
MRLALIFVVASLVGCASYPVQTDTSTIPVVREADQAQRRAQRRAERRRTRPQRLAAAAVALEALNVSLSAAVAIKEAKHGPSENPGPVAPPLSGPLPLFLVGDDYGETFLGCLSCDPYEATSIFNAEGEHGSRNSAVSIRNRYSRFGSSFSNTSACNARASRPPLIVDAQGNVHGRFTVNARAPEATVDGVTLRLAHMLCTRPRM